MTLLQNIIAFAALFIALYYLMKRFVWNPKRNKNSKGCGGSNCGCD